MEVFISLCIGIGLSAACGFRVFVPPLVVSLAAHLGYTHLSSDFSWMGTDEALWAFALATCLEIAAYYIPFVDNLLDAVVTPLAVVAGTLVTASFLPQGDPLVQWTVALIAGGGAAGTIQSFAGITRLLSTATTGGVANFLLATVESGSAFILSGLAIFVPVLAVGLVIALLLLAFSQMQNLRTSIKVESSQD